MLKAILFDYDQTLVNSANGFRKAEHWLQNKMHETLGEPDWSSFIDVYRRARATGPGSTPAQKLKQWVEVCRYFDHEPDESALSQWKDGYWDRVAAETRPVPEAATVLGELGKELKLGMLTNASAARDSEAPRHERFPEVTSSFDAIVIGGENGTPPKPDPAGFKKVLDLLGTAASEALFVGDDWTDDVCGAENAGIFPVWLRHASIRRAPVEPPPGPAVLIDTLHPLLHLRAGDSLEEVRHKLNPQTQFTGAS